MFWGLYSGRLHCRVDCCRRVADTDPQLGTFAHFCHLVSYPSSISVLLSWDLLKRRFPANSWESQPLIWSLSTSILLKGARDVVRGEATCLTTRLLSSWILITASGLRRETMDVFQELWYFVKSMEIVALLCCSEMCVLHWCFCVPTLLLFHVEWSFMFV